MSNFERQNLHMRAMRKEQRPSAEEENEENFVSLNKAKLARRSFSLTRKAEKNRSIE